MSISERNDVLKVSGSARRLEIFTGAGRRRAWTTEQKAAIVSESFDGGASVSHVARRHGLMPQQVFAWRRQARREADEGTGSLPFAPVVVEPPSASPAAAKSAQTKRAGARPHVIELDVEGSSVWIWPGAETAMVTAIVGALKAAK